MTSTDETPAAPAASDPPAETRRSGAAARSAARSVGSDKLPIRMLNDRILVKLEQAEGERRSTGGILIPATAQMGKRLAWATVVAVGPNVRTMQQNDKVLFNPEDRYEVEVRGDDYIILRERDIHAVAAERLEESAPGLYL
ncbi:MAG: co-chaperone GroES [Acidimicrobiales bacterium]